MHLLLLFLATTARVSFAASGRSHSNYAKTPWNTPMPSFGQWHLRIGLLYFLMNGQTIFIYGFERMRRDPALLFCARDWSSRS
uniref:Putative immunoglobulin heavy chain variable region n=1 Tax=Ixodes ricinus TaxID=34613 RepID=A0A147BRJ3_IXORI